MKGYAKNLGIEFIKIDSNISDLLKWDFLHTHVPRNTSAILLFQKLFAKYYYSSSYRYEDTNIGPHYNIALADPAAVHLLSTETLECISVGCQYSRVEKTKRITKLPDVNHWLNVCASANSDGRNCSVCWKCCRTLLTLEILGILEDFKHVFDLKKWRSVKNRYLKKVLEDKTDQYVTEIREYANLVDYHFKPWHLVASKIYVHMVGYPFKPWKVIPSKIYKFVTAALKKEQISDSLVH